jgi:hypothetical protein|uniref:Uncharacterized protein n=1 Tax=viral metagenome TaxID=1070528 RepID=A0A6C0ETJ7_9ZZZZ
MNLRDYRILNLAVIDYVVTFVFVLILHSYMWFYADISNKTKRTYLQYIISLLYIFISILGLATILHFFFGIKSVFSKYLGFND